MPQEYLPTQLGKQRLSGNYYSHYDDQALSFESWILITIVDGLAARTLKGHSICMSEVENEPYGIHDACQSCFAWLNECKQYKAHGSELRASSRNTYHHVLHTLRTSPTIDDHRAPATTDPTPYVAEIMETHRPSTDEIHGLSMPVSIISFIWNVDVEFAVHICGNKAISASMCYRAFDSCRDPAFPNPFRHATL